MLDVLRFLGRQTRNGIEAVNISGSVRMYPLRKYTVIALFVFTNLAIKAGPLLQIEDRNVVVFSFL